MNETYAALKRLVEQMNLIMRGVRGYGSGQPWSPRNKAKGLGKSFVEEFVEEHSKDNAASDGDRNDDEFKVSKVFQRDEGDNSG